MPNRDFAVMMARYNTWQNESLLASTKALSEDERKQDRGAFFGSIEATFGHVLLGDQLWMGRFAEENAPAIGSLNTEIKDWAAFVAQRRAFDREILAWAQRLEDNWFKGDLKWSSIAAGRDFSHAKAELIVHFFNHQTHHRGQIHAMLTAAGAKTTDTDIPFMPNEFRALK